MSYIISYFTNPYLFDNNTIQTITIKNLK